MTGKNAKISVVPHIDIGAHYNLTKTQLQIIMKDFKFYAPTQVVFGRESEKQVAQLVKKYGGTKVLLHYGGKSAENSGLLGARWRSA